VPSRRGRSLRPSRGWRLLRAARISPVASAAAPEVTRANGRTREGGWLCRCRRPPPTPIGAGRARRRRHGGLLAHASGYVVFTSREVQEWRRGSFMLSTRAAGGRCRWKVRRGPARGTTRRRRRSPRAARSHGRLRLSYSCTDATARSASEVRMAAIYGAERADSDDDSRPRPLRRQRSPASRGHHQGGRRREVRCVSCLLGPIRASPHRRRLTARRSRSRRP